MKILKRITALFAVFICALMFFIGDVFVYSGRAENSSSVLLDLRKDSDFNEADYPQITDTKNKGYGSVQVIQIAETENKTLVIYTYEPSRTVEALNCTAISMWNEFSQDGKTSNGKEFTPVIYDLELLSSYGVFSKYLVKDYVVEDETYRYYNLISIYREVSEKNDSTITNGETDAKAYSVGQQWCAYWFNGKLTYEMNTFEVLDIKTTYNGTIEIEEGFTLGSLNVFGSTEYGTSHYIAFNAENYVIKHIYDADMSFRVRSVLDMTGSTGSSSFISYGDWTNKTVYLSDVDEVSYTGAGLGAKTYNWNRIMSSEDFVANVKSQDVDLSSEAETKLKESQWVFSFYESESHYVDDMTTWEPNDKFKERYTEVDSATILRVKFMDINHKIYNLGVVMDMTSPDNIPDGVGSGLEIPEDFWEKLLKAMLGVLAIIVLVVLCVNCFPLIISGIVWVFKAILKGIGAIFRGIGSVFRISKEASLERKRRRMEERAQKRSKDFEDEEDIV